MKHFEIKTKTEIFPFKIGHTFYEDLPNSVNLPVNEMQWYLDVTNKTEILRQLQASGITSISFKKEEQLIK
jgi:hypothetical protein